MSLPKHFNILMASAVSVSIAATPVGIAPAFAQSAPAAEAPGDSGWQKEFELWRSSNASGKVEDYQKYLRVYPSGKFASVAKTRIEELNTAAATQKPADETAAVADATKQVSDSDAKRDLDMWRQVSKTGKLEDYQKYLKDFPQGKFAKVAKTRVETLTASAPGDQQDEATAKKTEDNAASSQVDDQSQSDQAQSDQAQSDQAQQAGEDVAQKADSAKKQPADADWEQEYALWKAASDGNTVTEYEAYLRAYPDGKFAAIAQARIAQLAAAEQPDPTISEGDSQDTAAKASSKRKNQAEPADDQADQADDQGDDQATDQADQQDDGAQPADDQDMADQSGADDQQQTVGGLKTKQNGKNEQAQFTEGNEDTEDATLDRQTRVELQGRLSSLGYDTLGIDGVFGERSRDAIASWQQDNGAPVTGYLSEDQVEAIFTASAATYATWLASRVPARVHRVRPRTEWVLVRPRTNIVVVKRRPAAVVVVKPGRFKFKNRVNVRVKFGNCRKRRRC